MISPTEQRPHTLKSIAESVRRDKRTIQIWYFRAKTDRGDFGVIAGGTRRFNDAERSILLSYGTSTIDTSIVDQPSSQIVVDAPSLPDRYSLDSLQVSQAQSFDDPLAVAQKFTAVADMLVAAMESDIEARSAKLNQAIEAKKQIDAKSQELRLEQRLYRDRTKSIDSQLTSQTNDLQVALEQLASLGKCQSSQ